MDMPLDTITTLHKMELVDSEVLDQMVMDLKMQEARDIIKKGKFAIAEYIHSRRGTRAMTQELREIIASKNKKEKKS